MGGPFPDASSSKLPFLVANEQRPFDERASRNHLGIVHLEPHHLQLVLDIAGEDQLEAIKVFGKEVKPIALIHVMRHLLTKIRYVENPTRSIE